MTEWLVAIDCCTSHLAKLCLLFLGISGVLGLYPVYIGIGTTLLGILVSIAEAVLVAVCIRASIRIKQTESYLSANENRDKDILVCYLVNL